MSLGSSVTNVRSCYLGSNGHLLCLLYKWWQHYVAKEVCCGLKMDVTTGIAEGQ